MQKRKTVREDQLVQFNSIAQIRGQKDGQRGASSSEFEKPTLRVLQN